MTTEERVKELGKEVITGVYHNIPEGLNCGLTKREYFAGLAMQGMAGNTEYMEIDVIASDAVRIADALLNELCREE